MKAKNATGEEVPVGHMCGHDLHTSCLVGTACLLAQGKQTWSGMLMIVAQPGEETMQGAKAMLNDGLFTRFPKPNVALAQHTMCFPAGTIGYHPGYTLAAEHNVRIRLFGVGGHGSMPQKSIAPVVMASALVMRLQTIVSREIAPEEMAVVTVGAIKRRTAPMRHEILRYRDIELDTLTRVVHRGIHEIALSPTEYELLTLFLRRPHHVLTQEMILQRVWGTDFVGTTAVIGVYIGYLRANLEAHGEPRLIQTVRGVGYILKEKGKE